MARQTETVYSNKVSKVMQETESVLRQVHIDLDEADRARKDLLAFQLKNKKLTWVPDQLVAACQAQGCGRVRRGREGSGERGRAAPTPWARRMRTHRSCHPFRRRRYPFVPFAGL